MNLSPGHWVRKFLYPFALDPAPPKFSDVPTQGATVAQLLGKNHRSSNKPDGLDLIQTKRF